jgi:cell cycle protein kinase DBF2
LCDRLIAHASVRYSSLEQVEKHPFFTGVKWKDLRSVQAPFVPALDSEIDTGYYDDFTSPEDMAKYAEVKEKQRNVDRVREKEEEFNRGVWVGFTFGRHGPGFSARGMGGAGNEEGALTTMF